MARFRFSQTCCTSPAAMWLWADTSRCCRVWSRSRSTWPTSEPYGDTLLLTALGAACFVNFGRNRTLHCGLTGPLFLVAAMVAILMEAGVWRIKEEALWGVVLVGVALAFLIEWRVPASIKERLSSVMQNPK